MFPDFIRSLVLSGSPTRIYQFTVNNNASFHLWWKENLLKYQKVSNFCKHDYGRIFVTAILY